eukprot:144380_1
MSCCAKRPIAVITGASDGIGAGIAVELIENGWNVCILARSLDKMKKLTSKYDNTNNQIKHIKCDVLIPSQIFSTCKQIKSWNNDKLNLLVNNVGGGPGPRKNLKRTTLEEWDYTLNLNLRSTFLFSQQLLSSLKNAAKNPCKYNGNIYDASIINLSSAASKDSAFYKSTMSYSVAKAGINQLTKLNALELSKYKIRVNAILPGWIRTSLFERNGLSKEQTDFVMKQFVKLHPIGRVGSIDDVVQVVKFLANQKQSGWITGQLIGSDGGWTLLSGFSKL